VAVDLFRVTTRRAVLTALAGMTAGTVGGAFSGVGYGAGLPGTDRGIRSARPGPATRVPVGTDVVWRGGAARRAVALTFDDGPDPRWTPRVLDVLARHGARSTFFCVGERVAAHPELVRRTAAAGHELANHTWSHCHLGTTRPDRIRAELRRTHDVLTELTGRAPTLLRPPWGKIDPPGLLAAGALGYRVVLWSHLVRGGRPAEDAAATLAAVTPGAIVLAHDGGPTPTDRLLDELDGLCGDLRADGYRLVTVSELLAGARPQVGTRA
jgi:peptidoglycan/xylan/chitin deacetylase (PgdA/CDA1 family)